MEASQARKRIEQLTDDLNYHNYLYYQASNPKISDYEFDQLLKELEKLENEFPEFKLEHSPTNRIGGDITKEFETVVHKYRMLSLGNTYSKEELEEFDERVKKGLGTDDYEYFCELKFDGVAISLQYEGGILKRGITRGDGSKGDDITTNIKTIKTLPLKTRSVPQADFYEVRGEVFMPKEVFRKLNEERAKNGEALFQNPRNTTSGTLKMQDSKVVADRKLDCYLYSYLDNYRSFRTHEESIQFLENAGFNVSKTYQKCKNISEVLVYISTWEEKRHDLPVETDGVVLKINSFDQQAELGYTAKNPRWAIAYKYKAENATTVLKNVKYQVGRTGAITPVAELDPVLLGGTTVKRASLHNANEIARLDIRLGDTVHIEKGGEIIPKITSVVLSARPKDSREFKYPTTCPECGSLLIRKDGEAQHYCPNEEHCPPQVLGRIEHFISRNAMDIATLGPRTIKGFLKNGLITNLADLYDLYFDQINGLLIEETDPLTGETTKRSIKEKSARNIINSIEASKSIPFERVLFGLGIRYVGKTVAETLAHHFKSIDQLSQAGYDEIIGVHEIGERIAESVIQFFMKESNLQIIEKLRKAGLEMEIMENEASSNVLANKTFVVSGVFTKYGREGIKEVIKLHGGRVSSSLSSKTDFLLAGENMGPAKKEKAESLGITILDEKSFDEMIKA